MVELYYSKLQYTHPLINSEKFMINSYSKWACQELLNYIDEVPNLPFSLTSLEILEGFSNKMKNYACLNSHNSLGFAIASDTVDYLIEEYWRYEARK